METIDLYESYLNERLGREILKTDKGFIVYQILEEEIFIADVFVHPDFRGQGVMAELAKTLTEHALERGCTYSSCTVAPSANGSSKALKYIMDYGYKLYDAKDNAVVLINQLIKE